MISGLSKLQVPLGSESHGRGTFTLASPFIASRLSGKEQSFSLCRSYGDRGGLEPHSDSMSFPEPKMTLVENLVGALINATEILDEYAYPSCVSAAFKGFLGFEALSHYHDLALATDPGHAHEFPHDQSLWFSHERLTHGHSAHSPVLSPDCNVLYGSLRRANNAHVLHSVWSSSSSALHSENISHGNRNIFVSSSDHGHNHRSDLPASSEEDILLQEARLRNFRSRTEPVEWKGSRQVNSTSDGLVNIMDARPHHPQQAKAVRNCESHIALEGHAESGKCWSFPEVMTLSRDSSLFWGGIALSLLLARAFFVTCKSNFSMRVPFQRSSVKRRILKSQWYGNPGSQSLGHRNFQMRISEFSKYPVLEVDGDRKLLRFPVDSTGTSAAFDKGGSHLSGLKNTDQMQPVRKTTNSKPIAQVSTTSRTTQGKPIRQTIHGSKEISGQQHGPNKPRPYRALNGKSSSNVEWPHHGKMISQEGFLSGKLHGRRVSESVQEDVPIRRTLRMVTSKSRMSQSHWGKDDELDLDHRIQKLYQTIQAVEQHRRAAMIALQEERQRSLALEEEVLKQREASALLGEEVRLLKESHSALVTSLRKKYSTAAAARTAADLVYQDWERHAAAE